MTSNAAHLELNQRERTSNQGSCRTPFRSARKWALVRELVRATGHNSRLGDTGLVTATPDILLLCLHRAGSGTAGLSDKYLEIGRRDASVWFKGAYHAMTAQANPARGW